MFAIGSETPEQKHTTMQTAISPLKNSSIFMKSYPLASCAREQNSIKYQKNKFSKIERNESMGRPLLSRRRLTGINKVPPMRIRPMRVYVVACAVHRDAPRDSDPPPENRIDSNFRPEKSDRHSSSQADGLSFNIRFI